MVLSLGKPATLSDEPYVLKMCWLVIVLPWGKENQVRHPADEG
jgi:hypothetical protein